MKFLQALRTFIGWPQYELMTLGQLVTLVAARPSARNRKALYGRLLFSKLGATAPEAATSKPGKHVTQDSGALSIPSMYGPDGCYYLVVCCDIPAVWAAHPEEHFFEVDARVILETAARNGIGVIIQNALDSQKSWITVPYQDVPDILSGKHTNTTVVPPGYKVVVVQAMPGCDLGQTQSGVWIAQFGSVAGVEQIIAALRELVAQTPNVCVAWIVQPVVLESSAVFETVVSALESIARNSTGHVVVVPSAMDRHGSQLKRLCQVGVPLRHAGPHGECFVEVHTPDGITPGWPGPPVT